MSAPKRAGTAYESLMVSWLNHEGFVAVERRALRGARDAGDLTGMPLIHIPGAYPIAWLAGCKNEKVIRLGAYMDELARQQVNLMYRQPLSGVLPFEFVKRRGTTAARSYVVMEAGTLAAIWRLLEMQEDGNGALAVGRDVPDNRRGSGPDSGPDLG